VFAAKLWLGVLQAMADSLEEVGVKPAINPADLEGAIVLTCDQVLPAEIELTPEIVAVGGSSALLAQRMIHRKKIEEHKARREADQRFRHAKPAQREPEPAPPPEPVMSDEAAELAADVAARAAEAGPAESPLVVALEKTTDSPEPTNGKRPERQRPVTWGDDPVY
jgi:hypothetical protein